MGESIVAGIIAIAVGDHLLIAEPGPVPHGVGLAMALGGPVLYLLGESLFRLRVTRGANAKRLAVAAVLVLLAPGGLMGDFRHLGQQPEGTP